VAIVNTYRPPGVYVTTDIEIPDEGFPESVRIPAFIGEGTELLTQTDLEIVRGSSSVADQNVVLEDERGRAVRKVMSGGIISLTDFDGVITKFRVHHYPIVDGAGIGRPTTSQSDVQVFVDGRPAVVQSVDGVQGIIELVVAPDPTSTVACTYYFKRTDTQFTDDLSFQVTPEAAVIYGLRGIADTDADNNQGETLQFMDEQVGPSGQVVVPGNNRLLLNVDRAAVDIRIPPGRYTMRQAANSISAARAQSLRAGTLLNNLGLSTLSLTADHELEVTGGSACSLLGLEPGQLYRRRRTFVTNEGPIVDGSNGGVTTTDPTKVVVRVDGETIPAESVDGRSRQVTLSIAPRAGAKVVITYWSNTWQDTYDYLGHRGVTRIVRVGDTPGRSAYTDGADYVLDSDRILWGASWSVRPAKLPEAGYVAFGPDQVDAFMLDDRDFLAPCKPVVQSVGGQVVQSTTSFIHPRLPTLGNGRDTPLGQSLFNLTANTRTGTPSDRPDLIWAYWGYDPQDALLRGRQRVVQANGAMFTLGSPVPVGAKVYATAYYNALSDAVYRLRCERAGASTFGTYRVLDVGDRSLFCAIYDPGSKGPAIFDVSLEWPGGSDLSSDARLEGVSDPLFKGPVEETITVHMATEQPTSARYAVSGSGPYALVRSYSDRARIRVNNADLMTGLAGIDLSDPANLAGFTAGFPPTLVGDVVNYTGGKGSVVGQSYTIDRPEELVLEMEGVQVTAVVPARQGATVGLVRDAINLAVCGWQGQADGGSGNTVVVPLLTSGDMTDRFKGWEVVVGDTAAAATPGQTRKVASYDPATRTITVSAPWAGGALVKGDPIRLRDPSAIPEMRGETIFDASLTISPGQFSQVAMAYVGSVTGATGVVTLDIPAGTYPTPGDLASTLEIGLNAAIAAIATKFAGLRVSFRADGDGRLVVGLRSAALDSAGALSFVAAPKGPAADFSVLAGFDTGSGFGGGQAVLVDAPVAHAFGVARSDGSRTADRLVIRGRLFPGRSGSVDPTGQAQRSTLRVLTGSAAVRVGMLVGDFGEGGPHALVRPASILMRANFGVGQDGTTGEPLVVFYDGTGQRAANNELRFTVDGQSVVVRFASSSGGTPTPVGPAANPNSLFAQVVAAMAAVQGTPFGGAGTILSSGTVRREGSGIRVTSIRSDERSIISVGDSTAAPTIGLSPGQVAERTLVSVRRLVSGLNAYRATSATTYLLRFDAAGAVGTFGNVAVASVEHDEAGSEFLHLSAIPLSSAGYGTSSQVAVRDSVIAGRVSRSWLAYGTGIGSTDGQGDIGEPRVDGFYVTSDNPNGSGSANDSVLNAGVGQDGLVGQTYRDRVTGLTFTLLPRGWSENPDGPWQSYPSGGGASFNIRSTRVITAEANRVRRVIPGLELKVSDTLRVKEADEAVLRTLDRRGLEPAVGALYYATYQYLKPSFAPGLFTRQDAVEAAYGPSIPDNPVSLAAFLAFLNGAAVVAIRQVPREGGFTKGSLAEYVRATEDLESPVGEVSVDMIMLLRGDSPELMQVQTSSNAKMSAFRIKQERTSIFGLSAGSDIATVKNVAGGLFDDRARVVYPDVAFINRADQNGVTKRYFVDGTLLAAALSGIVTSPRQDVATPWTGRRIAGFAGMGRRLSEPQANEVAAAGVTVITPIPGTLKVRHGLTTNTSNVLTQEPTVRLIADEVQQESRALLDPFIGIKYLPGVAGQVEGRLSNYLKFKKKSQIIRDYRDVKALAGGDAVSLAVAAKYAPVLPLLYIDLKYTLTTNLD